jgi:hypothetical protein
MTNHANHSNSAHAKHLSHMVNATDWLIEKLHDFRDKRELSHQIKLLQSLDRHILWDMGVDIKALFSSEPKIIRVEPDDMDFHEEPRPPSLTYYSVH